MITAGLRRAISPRPVADADPLLRPGPVPGSYASSLPFRLDPGDPRAAAAALAARLREQLWIAEAEVTGPGFLTVTVTHATLARLAMRIAHGRPGLRATATRWPAAPSPAPRPAAAAGLAAGAGGPRRPADRPARRRRGRHH